MLTPDGVSWLERVWRRDEKIPGLTFAETDEIVMAMELAVREVPGWQQILQAQLDRTQNPDRKARFAFVMPALSADPQVRQQAFERFRQLENRRREPWVLESMAYLNHPLREADSERFIRPSLELLREIQRTGRHLLPGPLGGQHAVGPSLAGRGGDGPGFSGEGAAVSRAAPMDDPQRVRRAVQSCSTIGPLTACGRPWRASSRPRTLPS